MIDTEQEILCLDCHKPVQQILHHKKRLYCNDLCKVRYHRKKKAQEATEQQRASNQDTQARIAELEDENRKLRELLDADTLYRRDTEYHTFKSWLKKQGPYPEGSFMHRFIDDKAILPRGTHGMVEEKMEKLKYSAEDMRMFRDFWVLMLRAQMIRQS